MMTPDAWQDLIDWLCWHEEDIKLSMNDFGELKQVFIEVVGREAGSVIDTPDRHRIKMER